MRILKRDPDFSLVLMDMQMPVMDGFQATEMIRTQLKLTDLPIIALTAYTMKGDQEKCLAVGCNDYLGKPLDMKKLADIIEGFIKKVDRKTYPAPSSQPTTSSPEVEDSVAEEEEFLREIQGDFVETFSKKARGFKEAMEVGDFKALRFLGHGLKGASGTVGFPELSDLGGRIELAAEEQNINFLEELAFELEEEFSRILAEFSGDVRDNKSS